MQNLAYVVAAPPSQWDEAPAVGALDFLLILALIPLGLFLVIALLTYVPSMVRGSRSDYQPGLAWRNEPEWFGGPRDGLERADKTAPDAEDERGGASGRW